ncbi:MAG TPA: fumarylacetoacetate hydrolase family protein [Acidimicrobiia bacterium]
MNSERIGDLARSLDVAWTKAYAIPAPTTIEPALSVTEAYAIQGQIIAQRVSMGRRVAGWKLGLTSADPPTTPIVGTLLDDMVIPSGSVLSTSTMVGPMVEAEFVVELGETLHSTASVTDLQRGPHLVGPGIEVIDYRTTGSQGPIDWIADNSTVAYAVVGDLVPVGEVDPIRVETALTRDGTHLAKGRGDKVMGNPLAAVAWLSGFLLERGEPLRAGEVVLTGSLTGHHPVPEGESSFEADFGDLGTVSVSFHA